MNTNSIHSQPMSQQSQPQQPMEQIPQQMSQQMNPSIQQQIPQMNEMQQQMFTQQYPQQMYQQMQQPTEQQATDLVVVKTYIEQYLQYYYTYDQIIAELEKKGIPQNFTTLVLQSLIAQNRNYFTAYEIRVNLNDQIDRFNKFITRHFQIAAHQMVGMDQNQQSLNFNANEMQQEYTTGGFINGFTNDGNLGM